MSKTRWCFYLVCNSYQPIKRQMPQIAYRTSKPRWPQIRNCTKHWVVNIFTKINWDANKGDLEKKLKNILILQFWKTLLIISTRIIVFFLQPYAWLDRLSKCHKHCKQCLCKNFRALVHLLTEHTLFCCKLNKFSWFCSIF